MDKRHSTKLRRKVKARPRQWPLPRLWKACKAALPVWYALHDLANESGTNTVTPTRAKLAQMTGIRRLPTITDALRALSQGKWLRIEHIPVVENRKQVGTVLKIKLFHRANENRYTGKKSDCIAQNASRAHENRSLASARKSLADLPKGRGVQNTPPTATAGGGFSATTGNGKGRISPPKDFPVPLDDTGEEPMVNIAEMIEQMNRERAAAKTGGEK